MDKTAEIVRALRLCADDEPANCIECPGDSDVSSRTCSNKLMVRAADTIESLNDFQHSQCAHLLARVEELQAKLAEAQRREQAAVEDMKVMTLAMRENEELSESCCFACLYDGQNLPDNVILAYGECPGYDRDDCFEWSGPQGAGKGETG